MGWKEIVSAVAPVIGTALGGPLGGMAANMVTDALGLPSGSNDTDIERQLLGNPEYLTKIKTAEFEFEKRLAELGIDLERIHSEDRNSARNREIQVKDKIPALLALTITVGFFGVLAWMLQYGIPDNGGEALLVMLGSLGSAWSGVIAYFFGSTASSARKNELIARK